MTDKKLEHNRRHFDDRVFTRLEADGQSFSDFKAVFAHFRSYDPSRTGAYTTWLIKTYCEVGFLFEDLDKAKETLQWFDEVKRRLPVERRNIADYPTLADVWKVVKPFVEKPEDVEPSKREQRRKEQEEVYTETIFLEETDDFRAVIPLTLKAAKWWGRGTRWCTAADENNMFLNYHLRAPLIVFDFKDGHKWQMWETSTSFQFMDEDDSHVSQYDLYDKWSFMKKYIMFSIIRSSSYKLQKVLDFVPDEYNNHDFYARLINMNGSIIEHLQYDLLSSEICSIAVKQNGLVLEHVPDGLKTAETCMTAVEQNGMALLHVPFSLQTDILYLKAVKQNGLAIDHVPLKSMTRAICMEAVAQNGAALQHVPDDLRMHDLCMKAVEGSGISLQYVPDDLRTHDICIKALEQDGYAIKYVPASLQTPELHMKAVRQNGCALRFILKIFRTADICSAAVETNGLALEYVPEKMKTLELCSSAFSHNKLSIIHFPKNILIETSPEKTVSSTPRVAHDFIMAAIKENGFVFSSLPDDCKTHDICIAAVKQNGQMINRVPLHLRTMDLYVEAVKQDWRALAFVPDDKKTTDMYLSAALQNGCPLSLIPPEHKVETILLAISCSNDEIPESVPDYMRTKDFMNTFEKHISDKCLDFRKKNGTDAWMADFFAFSKDIDEPSPMMRTR